jgi:hypothetical protein
MKTSKRIDERTPNGGAYSITHFSDKDRKPCDENSAVHYEIIEYDENDNEIARNYA